VVELAKKMETLTDENETLTKEESTAFGQLTKTERVCLCVCWFLLFVCLCVRKWILAKTRIKH